MMDTTFDRSLDLCVAGVELDPVWRCEPAKIVRCTQGDYGLPRIHVRLYDRCTPEAYPESCSLVIVYRRQDGAFGACCPGGVTISTDRLTAVIPMPAELTQADGTTTCYLRVDGRTGPLLRTQDFFLSVRHDDRTDECRGTDLIDNSD